MLTRIDSKVIYFIDCQTTKVRKKGLLPLNELFFNGKYNNKYKD